MKSTLVLAALFVFSTASAQTPAGSASKDQTAPAPGAPPLSKASPSGGGTEPSGSGAQTAAPGLPTGTTVPSDAQHTPREAGSTAGQAQGVGPQGGQATGGTTEPAAATPPPGGSGIETIPCPGTPDVVITKAESKTVPTNAAIRFDLKDADIIPEDAKSAGLEVKAGQAICLRFTKTGDFKFQTSRGQKGGITAQAWYELLAAQPINEYGNFWMPKAVNIAADDSDLMYYAVLALSAFFFVAIAFAVVYFTIKYRHRPGHKPEPSAAHNDALEITWTVIPTIIVVFLFWFGWRSYIHVVTPPNKAVEINVLAWRWSWQFTHSNGVTDSDLHVPVNTPVRLVMTSKDVLHSFYAPAFRVKQDVIPRRYTYVWFYATKPGVYRLTCAEYCGTSHAQMACLSVDEHSGACLRRAVVVVHEPGKYEQYLADKEQEGGSDPVALGKKLYEKKGCAACHTIDGSARVGPTFLQKDWGKDIQIAGGTVKMDENYIRESLMSPQAKGRPGFPASMPSFEGQLKQKELEGLIAFIKSLKE